MDMGSLLGTILMTILNYKRDPYVNFQGSLIRLILTVAHPMKADKKSEVYTEGLGFEV